MLIESSIQDGAPIPDFGDQLEKLGEMVRGRNLKRWACRWRTILLSSLGRTLYPYSQYIRKLNLCDLKNLLGESKLGEVNHKSSK